LEFWGFAEKTMERHAWKALVAEGKQEEYIKRHNEIWPEMIQEFDRAGIHNYSIWLCGNTLFGYYECEKGYAYSAKMRTESPVTKKWNEYMSDILIFETDPKTGKNLKLTEVFYLS
jgi:L-rhamnose mutarotase